MLERIKNLLPGFNCGNCGYTQCDDFARSLINKTENPSQCPVLLRPSYSADKKAIEEMLSKEPAFHPVKIISGVIDHYLADIILHPLKNEKSCRETLLPFSSVKVEPDDVIRYRPLGCPITHIARVIDTEHNLITIVIIGPQTTRSTDATEILDLGICMVLAFQGTYEGRSLKVGETIRFLPHHCMMQKVHSGVVVNLENGNVRIEIIDLKVWSMPEKSGYINRHN
ncbi:(Fe-S)-binding protein [Marinilabilia salmonicolor]|uniref:(Fe-S)-binding protein n=1 Tax=Marinilabilia salmonicolor TaxID=989 RepID=UPI0002D7CE6F|nr:(Fe-S)-binding protein [Marinilabilia salmonicolor]